MDKINSVLFKTVWVVLGLQLLFNAYGLAQQNHTSTTRDRIKLNESWKFMWYSSESYKQIYDISPDIGKVNVSKLVDSL